MAEAFLRIPAGRIAVLIGPGGKTKKKIENATITKITLGSESGEISIIGKEADRQQRAESIVKAIGRGFSPDKAMLLSRADCVISVIKLKEMLGKSEKAIKQKKARVIGRSGQTRNRIERETGCKVSVYGNTISIIGQFGEIGHAESVIKSILEGANISTAFEMLRERLMEEKRFEL